MIRKIISFQLAVCNVGIVWFGCWLQSNVENVSPQIIRQVTKELVELQKEPPEGIKVFINEEDITDIHALIEGPGTVSAINYSVVYL